MKQSHAAQMNDIKQLESEMAKDETVLAAVRQSYAAQLEEIKQLKMKWKRVRK